jgi:mannose/fructose/N-acetylgalactosamine-specific phosphotransferase system component IIC
MNNSMQFLLRNFTYQSPALIAYLVGLILALANWGRLPKPSQFLFFGSLLLLAGSLGVPVLQMARFRGPTSLYSGIGLVATLVRAAGFALVIAAVFCDRRQAEGVRGSGFQVMQSPPPMPPRVPPGPRV